MRADRDLSGEATSGLGLDPGLPDNRELLKSLEADIVGIKQKHLKALTRTAHLRLDIGAEPSFPMRLELRWWESECAWQAGRLITAESLYRSAVELMKRLALKEWKYLLESEASI